MTEPYIHWTEECSYCYKRGICEYEDNTRDFRKALSMLHNGAKYVFGTINFKCDYFKLDGNKFNRYHIGVTDGTNP
jgi:hypothetical protein